MPWGLHVTQFVTSLDVLEASLWKHVWVFLYRSFLSFRRSLSGTMDPNLLRECAQRLLETADFIRNRTAAVTSTTQTTTTTTSSSTTAQPQPNSASVRSEHNRLFGSSKSSCKWSGNTPLALHKRRRRSCELHVEQVVRMFGDSRTANATVNLREDWPLTERPRGEEVIVLQRRKRGRGSRNHTCGLSGVGGRLRNS